MMSYTKVRWANDDDDVKPRRYRVEVSYRRTEVAYVEANSVAEATLGVRYALGDGEAIASLTDAETLAEDVEWEWTQDPNEDIRVIDVERVKS